MCVPQAAQRMARAPEPSAIERTGQIKLSFRMSAVVMRWLADCHAFVRRISANVTID